MRHLLSAGEAWAEARSIADSFRDDVPQSLRRRVIGHITQQILRGLSIDRDDHDAARGVVCRVVRELKTAEAT